MQNPFHGHFLNYEDLTPMTTGVIIGLLLSMRVAGRTFTTSRERDDEILLKFMEEPEIFGAVLEGWEKGNAAAQSPAGKRMLRALRDQIS